ncbi:MAG: hypothetical protein MUC49_13345 [Raineya sp.]|jgi:hypothetical protein|nr:hypothetical protein [Raineya sp.]
MALPIITQKFQKELSQIQKSFNQKIKQIDDLKLLLNLIEEHEAFLRKRLTSSFFPTIKEANKIRMEFAEKLNNYFFDNQFTKSEKKKISMVICEYMSIVLKDEENPRAIELYNMHTDTLSFEEEQENAKEMQKNMMKKQAEMFGFDLEYVDFEDPNSFMASMAEQAEEIQKKQEEKQAKRKKTPKQLEKEQQEAEQNKILNKTVKTLYTDLAKILHPDLEHNDDKKQEKTELMHQVTTAYEKNDVFALLNLHIKYAQEGENKLDAIAEEQIKLYIIHLNEQIKDLEDQIHLKRFANFSPMMEWAGQKNFERKVKQEEKGMKDEVLSLKTMVMEADDIAIFKKRLKNTDIDNKNMIDFDMMLEMMEMMNIQIKDPKKKKKK